MLRDANYRQVIQKFSFIENLNSTRGIDRADRQILNEIDLEQAFNFVPQPTSQSQKTPQVSSAIVATENTATIETNWYESSDDYGLSLAEMARYTASDKPADNYEPKSRNYLGKILFALSCSYCAFVLWWLFGHQANKVLTHLTGGRHITISKSDVEFIDYMERSLDTIDRQPEAKKLDRDRDEVVYVPVYTPNATPTFPQISSSNLPLTPLPNNNAPTIPEPVAIAKPKPTPPPQTLKIPAPPPLPAPTPLPEKAVEAPKAAATTSKPAIKHTLTGILELGAGKSAALVRINGQTRRFWIGEKIGNSQWVLESVSDRTATISDRGQVRSIAVGETF